MAPKVKIRGHRFAPGVSFEVDYPVVRFFDEDFMGPDAVAAEYDLNRCTSRCDQKYLFTETYNPEIKTLRLSLFCSDDLIGELVIMGV